MPDENLSDKKNTQSSLWALSEREKNKNSFFHIQFFCGFRISFVVCDDVGFAGHINIHTLRKQVYFKWEWNERYSKRKHHFMQINWVQTRHNTIRKRQKKKKKKIPECFDLWELQGCVCLCVNKPCTMYSLQIVKRKNTWKKTCTGKKRLFG